VPEQYIFVKCLLKHSKEIDLKHQRDVNEKNAIDSEKYIASNFIYLDWKQFNLNAPFHLRTFAHNDFNDLVTHIEWQAIYKKYVDSEHEVPNKDELRSHINSFRSYKKIANIVTFLIPFREARRKLRKKILERISTRFD
jgi:hypothetical protein